MDVVVLGVGINGLAVIRSLGSKGLVIGGVYNDATEEIGIHSKYLTAYTEFSVKSSGETLYRACLDLIADSKSKPVLICTTDLFAELVASNSEVFELSFTLTTPDKDLYWKFLQKQPTARICIDNGVAIPSTIFVDEGNSLKKACEDIKYPAIVKPNLTYEETFPGKVVVVNTKQELDNFIDEYPLLENRVVVQEIIPSGDGRLYIVSTFSDHNGKVQAIYTGKKVRSYLPDFGVTSYGVSCSNSHLTQISTKFLNDIKFTGFADLEFAYDEETGKYYFIELNIRTSYLNQLYKDSGIDLNYIGYLSANKKPFQHLIGVQKDGVYWLDFARDLGSFYWKLKKRELTLYRWLVDILKARSFAFFNIKDLKPFFISIKQLIAEKLSRLKRI